MGEIRKIPAAALDRRMLIRRLAVKRGLSRSEAGKMRTKDIAAWLRADGHSIKKRNQSEQHSA
jgi:hypothetical protein